MKKMEDNKIAGALFDFCGYLTTLGEEFMVGAGQNVTPLLNNLRDWAKKRKLNIDNADVENWNTTIHTKKDR